MDKGFIINKFVYNNKNNKFINNKNMEEVISLIINNIINSFDFPFCITTNIATYIIIKSLIDNKIKTKITTWQKRIIYFVTSIIIAIFYCSTGSDIKIIFNSFILAPVSWSWIFKPICNKLGIDYNSKQV